MAECLVRIWNSEVESFLNLSTFADTPYTLSASCHCGIVTEATINNEKNLTHKRLLFQEENDIPSCDLSGFVRPGPVIVAPPLSMFYRSSTEYGPIIPETQVRNIK